MNKYVLISVSDKTGIVFFAKKCIENGYKVISTGGTYKHLIQNGVECATVESITKSPEILNGRVKTLHPKIFGGILAESELQLKENDLIFIEMVVVNLYPFKKVLDSGADAVTVNENIDIGGHALIRSAIKGNRIIVTDPEDYNRFEIEKPYEMNLFNKVDLHEYLKGNVQENPLLQSNSLLQGPTRENFKKYLHQKALKLITDYDSQIQEWKNKTDLDKIMTYNIVTNLDLATEMISTPSIEILNTLNGYIEDKGKVMLKYGLNPSQKLAIVKQPQLKQKEQKVEQELQIQSNTEKEYPLKVLNGSLGMINILDALLGWQLVRSIKENIGKPAFASYKHNSPAGVAISGPITSEEYKCYQQTEEIKSDTAKAFMKARYCDPKSSFGDFLATNSVVDLETAKLIKREVSDGIIAPGYTLEALTVLKSKKKGNYVILEMDPDYTPDPDLPESRTMFGFTLEQSRNNTKINDSFFEIGNEFSLTNEELQDIKLGNITLKYTQSNSVAVVDQGRVIGIGAGQQNRIDCVKMSIEKAKKCLCRTLQIDSPFLYLNESETNVNENETNVSKKKTRTEKINEYTKKMEDAKMYTGLKLEGACLVSDAFFPFKDSIEECEKAGIKLVTQPKGAVRQQEINDYAKEKEIRIVYTKDRLFLH